jgi:hypothetical protein
MRGALLCVARFYAWRASMRGALLCVARSASLQNAKKKKSHILVYSVFFSFPPPPSPPRHSLTTEARTERQMSCAYLAQKNIHGSSMCCHMNGEDLRVLVQNGVDGVAVQKSECPHVDSVARFREHLSVDQIEAICRDPRLSRFTSASLCASSND